MQPLTFAAESIDLAWLAPKPGPIPHDSLTVNQDSAFPTSLRKAPTGMQPLTFAAESIDLAWLAPKPGPIPRDSLTVNLDSASTSRGKRPPERTHQLPPLNPLIVHRNLQ
jgi:hypothetical protein